MRKPILLLVACLLLGMFCSTAISAPPSTGYGEVDESVLLRLSKVESDVETILVRLAAIESRFASTGTPTPASTQAVQSAMVGNGSAGTSYVQSSYPPIVSSYSQPVGYAVGNGSAGTSYVQSQPVQSVVRSVARTVSRPVQSVQTVRRGVLGFRRSSPVSSSTVQTGMYCDENGCYYQ